MAFERLVGVNYFFWAESALVDALEGGFEGYLLLNLHAGLMRLLNLQLGGHVPELVCFFDCRDIVVLSNSLQH